MEKLISTAAYHLQTKNNILYPEQAIVKIRDFDPCRAVRPIATVTIPAIVNMREVTLSYTICEGDQIY